jgi:hypothetical protein
MEMTMATMGRLMKNLAIRAPVRPKGSSGPGREGSGRRPGLGQGRLDLPAGSHLLEPLDDDPLAGFQPLRDDPEWADALSNLDLPELDRVVGADHADLMDALHILYGSLGHEQRVLLHLGDRPDFGVLARAQHVPRIGERASCHHGAGRHVDLAVQVVRSPPRGVDASVSEDQLQLEGSGRARIGLPSPEHGVGQLLADGELRVDGIDLRHGGQGRGVARTDEIPDVRDPEAGDPVDGRDDLGIAEVELRVGERRAIRRDVRLRRLHVRP